MKIKLQPMSADQFERFKQNHSIAQAKEFAQSFGISNSEAATISASEINRSLPVFPPTEEHRLYNILLGTENVGHLWLSVKTFFGIRKLFVSDIFIDQIFRGRGIGKEVMALVETEAFTLGLSEVALHVFGSNAGARKIYEALGFFPTSIQMSKMLQVK